MEPEGRRLSLPQSRRKRHSFRKGARVKNEVKQSPESKKGVLAASMNAAGGRTACDVLWQRFYTFLPRALGDVLKLGARTPFHPSLDGPTLKISTSAGE